MSRQTGHERGELALIRRLRDRLVPPRAAAGGVPFGDDMAELLPGAGEWLWTVDLLMDGVDFDSRRHEWRVIGRKAMAVNLSDCAAMGVQPVSALCAVCLSNRLSMDDAEALIAAADECGRRWNCPIVGGDTNSWDAPTVISITVAARPEADYQPIRRDGAQRGDRVWVSGKLGGSLLGRHLTFEPRVDLGITLARGLRPHAMIDISDGLALDLGRIMSASNVGVVLSESELAEVVHSDAERLALQDGQPASAHALHDGEDFELLIVLPPAVSETTARGLGLLPIGEVIAEPGLWQMGSHGDRTPIPLQGWEHFR
jgi:thiamine-monophosphate kinase